MGWQSWPAVVGRLNRWPVNLYEAVDTIAAKIALLPAMTLRLWYLEFKRWTVFVNICQEVWKGTTRLKCELGTLLDLCVPPCIHFSICAYFIAHVAQFDTIRSSKDVQQCHITIWLFRVKVHSIPDWRAWHRAQGGTLPILAAAGCWGAPVVRWTNVCAFTRGARQPRFHCGGHPVVELRMGHTMTHGCFGWSGASVWNSIWFPYVLCFHHMPR